MELGKRRVNPTNDLLFKKALASPGHTDILKGFIKDFFGFEPEEVILETPYSIEDFKHYQDGTEQTKMQETRSDIRASLKTASFTAEMQINNIDFFDERALYYVCQTYCDNYNRQDEERKTDNKYETLRPVYAMNILKHTRFRGENAVRVFGLIDKATGEAMDGELLNVGYFELLKEQGLTVNQRHWQGFFMTGEVSEDAPLYIRKATEIVDYVNLAKEEQIVYDMVEKNIETRKAEMSYALKQGIQQGLQQGLQQGISKGRAESDIYGAKVLYQYTRNINAVKQHYPQLTDEELRAVQNNDIQAPGEKPQGIKDYLAANRQGTTAREDGGAAERKPEQPEH